MTPAAALDDLGICPDVLSPEQLVAHLDRRLDETMREVDSRGRAHEALAAQTGRFSRAFSGVRQPQMHETISLMHESCAAIEAALSAGVEESDVRDAIEPVKTILAGSPFVRRLQTWPRGFPGDYETIEYMAAAEPRCDRNDPHYWIEWYALNTAIAQQHRNKLAWQHSLIARAARAGGGVLSIGCGGCADVALDPSIAAGGDFVLVDLDAAALDLARDRLSAARSVTVIHSDAVRALREIVQLGPFDLILCGGLFDYLPDPLIVRLISSLHRHSLRAGGLLALTNIGDGNPFRTLMEYLASWRLVHRSRDDLHNLARLAGLIGEDVSIQSDATGLALLCSVAKPSPESTHSPWGEVS